MAHLQFVKTITEDRQIGLSEDGRSFGQMIDQEMLAAIAEGFTIQTVSFEISPEEWTAWKVANEPASTGEGHESKSHIKSFRKGKY